MKAQPVMVADTVLACRFTRLGSVFLS